MPQSWVGRTIDHYRITEKIGQGGSGQVFRGLDLHLERPVAVKVLRAELAADPDLAERFRCEAQTLARLNHPNIATLYRLLWEGELRVMVMEYVEGRTLDQIVVTRGPLPPELILPLYLQALAGVDHAHQQGIIHRDIKGSNVMATSNGLVKVMDFGIARALGSTGLTQDGRPVGTPEYMSPEQIRGEEVDARSDIYSLGVLLFKLLCGRVPFSGKSQFETMRAHLESTPRSLSDLVPGLEAELREALERALAKDPAERFAGVGELRAALEQALPTLRSPAGVELGEALGIEDRGASPVPPDLGTLDGDTAEVELAVSVDGETLPTGLEREEGASPDEHGAGPTRILPEAGPGAGEAILAGAWLDRFGPRPSPRWVGAGAILGLALLGALGAGMLRAGEPGGAAPPVVAFPIRAPALAFPEEELGAAPAVAREASAELRAPEGEASRKPARALPAPAAAPASRALKSAAKQPSRHRARPGEPARSSPPAALSDAREEGEGWVIRRR